MASAKPIVKYKTRIIKEKAKSAGGRAKAIAKERTKHTIWAVASAGALGLAEAKKVKLPTVGGLDPAALYGLGAMGLHVATNNKAAGHIATGLLSVAAYKLAAKKGASVGGDDFDDLSGDDDDDEVMGDVEIIE